MTREQERERKRLNKKWAHGKASMSEMQRCMLLDQKLEWEIRQAKEIEAQAGGQNG